MFLSFLHVSFLGSAEVSSSFFRCSPAPCSSGRSIRLQLRRGGGGRGLRGVGGGGLGGSDSREQTLQRGFNNIQFIAGQSAPLPSLSILRCTYGSGAEWVDSYPTLLPSSALFLLHSSSIISVNSTDWHSLLLSRAVYGGLEGLRFLLPTQHVCWCTDIDALRLQRRSSSSFFW